VSYGECSHCGVNAVDIVKIDGDWKIANWMRTVEKGNCQIASSTVVEQSERSHFNRYSHIPAADVEEIYVLIY